jgi:excisionase family DNA binding protein
MQLTRQQAADKLGVSLRFLDGLVASRQIEHLRFGRKVRFLQSHLDDYLARSTQPVVEPVANQVRSRIRKPVTLQVFGAVS